MINLTEQTITGGGFQHRITASDDLVVLTAWDVDGVLVPAEARALARALTAAADAAEAVAA